MINEHPYSLRYLPLALNITNFCAHFFFPIFRMYRLKNSLKRQRIINIISQTIFLSLFIMFCFTDNEPVWSIWLFIIMNTLLTLMMQARLYSLVYRVKVQSIWVFGLAQTLACVIAILFMIDFHQWFKYYHVGRKDDPKSYQREITISMWCRSIFLGAVLIISILLTWLLYSSKEIKQE